MNIKKIIRILLPVTIKQFIKKIIISTKNPTCEFKNSDVCFSTVFGKYVVIFENTKISFSSKIGSYTYISKDATVYNADIGAFCSIAKNVSIGLIKHITSGVSTSPIFYDYDEDLLPKFFVKTSLDKETLIPRTNIEADVWIGQNAMVKSGVTVGVGAVIGAGAIVTKDVEPYSIVAGVPAKHIKYRFEKDIRERLLASKWWEFDEKKLTILAPYFNQPEIFLEKLKEFDEI